MPATPKMPPTLLVDALLYYVLGGSQSRTIRMDHPIKRSLAETMRALRWCLRNLNEASEKGRGLPERLREALIDDYQRRSSKRARYRPPNPDKKTLGDPKIRVLTRQEKKKLRRIEADLAA
jgi:hypothetical protein